MTVTDESDFAQWHGAVRAAYLEGRHAMWWSSLDQTRSSHATPSRHRRRFAVGAFDRGTCVGGFELVLPDDEDTHTAEVELGVVPTERGRGVGTALWDAAVKRCLQQGRNVAQTELYTGPDEEFSRTPAGHFATTHGFTPGNVENRMILDLPPDLGEFARRRRHRPDETSYSVVSWVDACPQEHAAEFARLTTMMNEDVPSGQMTRTPRQVDVARVREIEERMTGAGWVLVRSMALDPTGLGAGYTEMLVSRDEPEFVVQEDTLVDRRHRGHRLGLALKSANLTALARLPEALMRHRRWVQTWTAVTNGPMLRTNEQFGFRTVDVLHECEATIGGQG